MRSTKTTTTLTLRCDACGAKASFESQTDDVVKRARRGGWHLTVTGDTCLTCTLRTLARRA